MQTVTYELALRGLNEAVAAKGHAFVYDTRAESETGCWNVNQAGTEPSCIVGWALAWLGVPLECMSGTRRGVSIQSLKGFLERDGVIALDEDAFILLLTVQSHQDQAMPWGEAVTRVHLGDKAFAALAPR